MALGVKGRVPGSAVTSGCCAGSGQEQVCNSNKCSPSAWLGDYSSILMMSFPVLKSPGGVCVKLGALSLSWEGTARVHWSHAPITVRRHHQFLPIPVSALLPYYSDCLVLRQVAYVCS